MALDALEASSLAVLVHAFLGLGALDIIYTAPISFLLERMQDNGLCRPNINPVLTDAFTRLTPNEFQQFIPETLAMR